MHFWKSVTNRINTSKESIHLDDHIETSNHFRCIDLIKQNLNYQNHLLRNYILYWNQEQLIAIKIGLMSAKLPNEVGETCPPKEVSTKIKDLLSQHWKENFWSYYRLSLPVWNHSPLSGRKRSCWSPNHVKGMSCCYYCALHYWWRY